MVNEASGGEGIYIPAACHHILSASLKKFAHQAIGFRNLAGLGGGAGGEDRKLHLVQPVWVKYAGMFGTERAVGHQHGCTTAARRGVSREMEETAVAQLPLHFFDLGFAAQQ